MSAEKRTSAAASFLSGEGLPGEALSWVCFSCENKAGTSTMETVNTFKKLRMRSSNRDLELPGAEHTKPPYWTEAPENGQPNVWLRRSENFHVERQIFLGVFPDRLHQLPRLHQHLVAVVVQLGILEQFAGRAFPLLQLVNQHVHFVDGGDHLFVRLVARKQWTDRALSALDIVHQPLEFSHRRVKPVVQGRIVNNFPDRTLPTFDKRQNAIHPLQQRVHVLQRPLAGAHHVLDIGLVAGRQRISVYRLWTLRLRA